ncbi:MULTISPECIES: amino acid ABC transporter substrate-binding protein [Clostridium]|uniref:amino acid ABC transporter substrate-binding protein n=1 Tax=Clostridium TaxID=1485 RepID=UPI00189FB099|nr:MULTISPECIES: amino acid ABC transporter substrate-binding protein [Clostridium]MBS7132687.1 amino acid ABC transporter substrate-binding protein [Clostridium sp.]MDU2285256.1 amino acid ABC transporter substrate-binding protein [Clostridium sp.]MDU4789255.1 amino acid ABC transporter substrate-binding protein [Clostridium sp.]
MSLKKIVKKGLLFTIIGAMALGLVACGDNKESETSSLDKEELVLGFDDTFVPMGFKDSNGEYTGFDIEMAKEISNAMGKKIKFQPINWNMKESELNNGNIDFIWNGFSITDERKEQVEFSKPYLRNRQVIVTLVGSSIKTKEDLKGKVVVAQSESSAINAIGDYKSNFKELVTFDTNEQALRDLEAGRADAIVADEILLKYYTNQKGSDKFNFLEDNFGEEDYAVGMKKGDTKLVKAFNKAYDQVVESGKASEISKKWFGDDIVVK